MLYRRGQGGGIQAILVVHQVDRFPDAPHACPVIYPDGQDIISRAIQGTARLEAERLGPKFLRGKSGGGTGMLEHLAAVQPISASSSTA